MDEEYLDELLGQVSKKDGQSNTDIDLSMHEDSDVKVDMSDLGDISLDELDDLDSVDLSDLDFDDIDFDDIDVTSLDANNISKQDIGSVDDDFNLDALLQEVESPANYQEKQEADKVTPSFEIPESTQEEVFQAANAQMEADTSIPVADDINLDMSASMPDDFNFDMPTSMPGDFNPDMSTAMPGDFNSGMSASMQGGFDSGMSTSMPGDFNSGMSTSMPGDFNSGMSASMLGNSATSTAAPGVEDVDNMDLDALFSALGIDENEGSSNGDSAYTAGQDDLDALFESSAQLSMEMGDLDDIQDLDDVKSGKAKKKKKQNNGKKKTFSEILFGEMDEEDEEEARILAENKEKKRIRKEQQKQVRDEKKAEKQETLEVRKKTDDARKQKQKAEKQKRKEAELQAELEEDKNEKHVSNLTVVIVFALFIGLAVVVVFGTKVFSYNQVIKRAQDYFERQRYRLAYDEVSGVEVKPKDEDLRDRIYTVMYVERLYESYANNMQLGRPDVALDALIRGLQKYDEHYEEAVELDIVDDIKLCRANIIAALNNTFHMTEEQAYALSVLEGQQYSALLQEYAGVVSTDDDTEQGE